MPRDWFTGIAIVWFSLISLSSLAQAPPSDDAYVTTSQPTVNFGSSGFLPVQTGTTSYIRFNLGGLPSNTGIAKATLRLYVDAVAAPGAFDVFQIDNVWSEGGITLSNAPSLGRSATSGRSVQVTGSSLSQFLLVDITSLAQGWLDGTIPNQGIALALTSGGGSFSFDSKESIGTGHQPELEVVFESSPATSVSLNGTAPVVARRDVGVTPAAPTDPYVDNGTALQTGANFNIDGNGSAATFNATSRYLLSGVPVLGSSGSLGLFLGPAAGQNNSGAGNSFFGVSAGQFNTSGSYNTFTGAFAGQANTTGSYLTFLGMQSGSNNTTGTFNSFVGTNSGYANTTGSYNTFLGQAAGFQNQTGTYNTFTGATAGQANTTGSYLTFLGMQSGFNNTTGGFNSFLGTNSGYANTTGSYNTFLGEAAGFQNKTGTYNTFTGTSAGQANTTGSYLTFLGMQAGGNNSTGQFNSFVGTNSGYNNTTGNNNTFVGEAAGFQNRAGTSNTFVGMQAGQSNTGGQSNTFLGFNAGVNGNPTGNNNVYISNPGVSTDNASIRIGDPAIQTTAFLAGVSGVSITGGQPVVISPSGQLGTSSVGSGVTSWNGRSGVVVPQTGDYNFSQISGSLAGGQLSGTYDGSVSLTNSGNTIAGSFIGNGIGLTGVLPAAGSPNYIQNGTSEQASANFNVSGSGTLGGALSANSVNSASGYQIGASSVLSAPGTGNLFLGQGAGGANGSGNNDVYLLDPGVAAENGTLRLGDPARQTSAYLAGVAGVSITGGLPVVINANGQLGTTSAVVGVTAWNSRNGAVVPQLGDYPPGLLGTGAANSTTFLRGDGSWSTPTSAVISVFGRSGAVAAQNGDYSFPLISGVLQNGQLSGTYGNAVTLSNPGNSFTGNGSGLTVLSAAALTGTLPSAQLSGTYSNAATLNNPSNSFNGTFVGNGSGLTGVTSGLSWRIFKKSANYTIQTSDFSDPTTVGNFIIATGPVSLTFTLPNPPPPNGDCVAVGSLIDAGINSGTNTYLTVSGNGLVIDPTPFLYPITSTTHPRRTSYFYCSDGATYYRLGYAQNGVSQIGPWLETLDTGAVNAYMTTFRNGMDFGLSAGSMIFLMVKNANTSTTPTLNVNGLGAKNITRYGNLPLAPGDLSPTAYALLIYDGNNNWELLNPQTARVLGGTTSSIGGSALTAGNCVIGTVTVQGAAVGHPVSVSASDGSLPNGLIVLSAAVTSANTVTVQLCAVASVTPAANTYNVATQ